MTVQSRSLHPPEYWRTLTCGHLGPDGCWSREEVDAQLRLFPGWQRVSVHSAAASSAPSPASSPTPSPAQSGTPSASPSDAAGKDDMSGPAAIQKRFLFADFNAMEPVLIRLLAIARLQDHHPDVQFGYRDLTVRWNTHSAGGISDNDWICAGLLEEALMTVSR